MKEEGDRVGEGQGTSMHKPMQHECHSLRPCTGDGYLFCVLTKFIARERLLRNKNDTSPMTLIM